MRRIAFVVAVAAGLAGASGRAEAQVLNSYGAYFPGGGRAFPGSTGYLGYYPDTPYPRDISTPPGLVFRFGRVPPTPLVPPPPSIYSPRFDYVPTGRRWAPAHYWRKV